MLSGETQRGAHSAPLTVQPKSLSTALELILDLLGLLFVLFAGVVGVQHRQGIQIVVHRDLIGLALVIFAFVVFGFLVFGLVFIAARTQRLFHLDRGGDVLLLLVTERAVLLDDLLGIRIGDGALLLQHLHDFIVGLAHPASILLLRGAERTAGAPMRLSTPPAQPILRGSPCTRIAPTRCRTLPSRVRLTAHPASLYCTPDRER